jgi:crossover junction endodeoxyribonuclease RuvC
MDPGAQAHRLGRHRNVLVIRFAFVASGTVKSDNRLDLAARLTQLYDGLEDGAAYDFQPFEAAVEHTFVNKDATATLKLGPGARCCHAGAGAGRTCGLRNMRRTRSRKAVIGVGHGDKKQIHMMVKVLMPKASFDSDDAADALAIAICHAHHRTFSASGAWRRNEDDSA